MTERLVKPIRAWAEYDGYTLFIEPQPDEYPERMQFWLWPKTGEFSMWTEPERWRYSIVHVLREDDSKPLHSLRVLYENGWWLRLDPVRGTTTTAISDWFWYLHQDTDAPEIPHGRFTEDKDSEAVERAMIAAASWFNQHDSVVHLKDRQPVSTRSASTAQLDWEDVNRGRGT